MITVRLPTNFADAEVLFNAAVKIEILAERDRREAADLRQHFPAEKECAADVASVEMDLPCRIGQVHHKMFLFRTDQFHSAMNEIDLRMLLQETDPAFEMTRSKFIIRIDETDHVALREAQSGIPCGGES